MQRCLLSLVSIPLIPCRLTGQCAIGVVLLLPADSLTLVNNRARAYVKRPVAVADAPPTRGPGGKYEGQLDWVANRFYASSSER